MTNYPRLMEIPLSEAEALVDGAMWLEPTEDGFIPLRLPESAWSRVPDLWAREMYRMAAGMRLRARTAATSLELDVTASVMAIAGGLLPDVPVTFDLVVDGADQGAYQLPRASVRSFDVSREPELVGQTRAEPMTLRFDGLSPHDKLIELWFPANAVVEIVGVRATGPLAPVSLQRPRWVHHGSSVSHCREVGRPTEAWPVIAARLADVDLASLAVGGNCHLDPFVARVIRDTDADVISIEVGLNIVMDATFTRRTFGPALTGFLDTIRDGHPEARVFVVSPIIGPLLEQAAGPLGVDETGSLTARRVDDDQAWSLLSLERAREAIAQVVATRNEPNTFAIDGLKLLGPEEATTDLADGFHPTIAGYQKLGKRFADMVFDWRVANSVMLTDRARLQA
jgi:hypothetical protein